MTRLRKIWGLGALLVAGCAPMEPAWDHPALSAERAAASRAACEAQAEVAAGPDVPLPRPCGGEITGVARDNCQRTVDADYIRLAARLRARNEALAACLTEAGFVRR